jgi:hypothetical protein
MAAAVKKLKIERDRFTDDGVRLFNPSKPHGVVYADGFIEVKFIQEYEGKEVHYRGDHAPVGYEFGVPLPKGAEELLNENEQLQARIRDLESAQLRTNELLAKLSQQLEGKAASAAPAPAAPPKAATRPSDEDNEEEHSAPREAPARGATKTK